MASQRSIEPLAAAAVPDANTCTICGHMKEPSTLASFSKRATTGSGATAGEETIFTAALRFKLTCVAR